MAEGKLVEMPVEGVDILENDIMSLSPELLAALLRDHTTGRKIFWATHDYEALGKGYGYHDEITPESITGANCRIITPRMYKAEDVQAERKRNKADLGAACRAVWNRLAKVGMVATPPDASSKGTWCQL